MMNERIKKLAEQAGWNMGNEVDGFSTRLEKFAELVAAAEREACAKVCDGWTHADGDRCAEAIRARGEQ